MVISGAPHKFGTLAFERDEISVGEVAHFSEGISQ